MITDGILLGLIAALSLLGSTHLLETLVHLLRRLFLSPVVHLVALAAEAGFNLQLASSLHFSHRRLTRALPPPRPRLPPALLLVSLVSLSLFLVLEVAVVYITTPRSRFQPLRRSAIPIHFVAAAHATAPLPPDFNAERQLHVSDAVFNDSVTARHVSVAYVSIPDIVGPSLARLENATHHPQQSFNVLSFLVADGFNEDGSRIDPTSNRRNTANLISFYIDAFGPEHRISTMVPARAVEALDLSRTSLFTDFNEKEARVFEGQMLRAFGLRCPDPDFQHGKTLGMSQHLQVVRFQCKATKPLRSDIGPGRAAELAVRNAILEIARNIFYIGKYESEHAGVIVEGRQRAGDEIDGVVGRYAGVEPRSPGFIIVCIAAALGVIRLVSGLFIDYRGVAEKVMFKAIANGSTLGGPGEWDGRDECEWKVYDERGRTRFGYTREPAALDADTVYDRDVSPVQE